MRRRRRRERRRKAKRAKARRAAKRDERDDFEFHSHSSSSDDDDDDDSLSDSSDSVHEATSLRGKKLSAMDAIQLERRWKEGRSWLKKLTVVDGIMLSLWSAVSIYAIGFGERCPAGTFAGWSDLFSPRL